MSKHNVDKARDIGGMVMGGVLILVASIALWDTTTMMDSDSYVFPRAIAIAMIVFSIMMIVWNLLHLATEGREEQQAGSTVRRSLLVTVMLLSCFAMPWLGFLISGILTFGLLMMVAMYDSWNLRRLIVYPVLTIAIVVGFYMLFSNLLQVPLPIGSLFE